jgi:hypothetical protein
VALPDSHPAKGLLRETAKLVHAGEIFDAARLVRAWAAQTTPSVAKQSVDTKAKAFELLNILLHWALSNGAFEEAAQLLWTPNQFDPRPNHTKRVWSAVDEHDFGLLMGAGKQSKSFSMAIRFFLEWLRDPEYTSVRVLGPSEDHLEANLFSHLVTLHRESAIPLPGEIGKLFIGLDLRKRRGSISGVVIPQGKKAAGRLQGVARFRRKESHPEFGETSRLFVFVDEISNLPKGLWHDIDNLLSNTSKRGGLKVYGAFNPDDRNNDVGIRTEPTFGWGSFDPELHFEWLSTRGWFVVRLDAMQSENIKEKREVFPGMQTYEGMLQIVANAGGLDSPGYWTMVRGCYPPIGVALAVIPTGLTLNLKCSVIWYDTPTPVAGADLALEGGDACRLCKGLFGRAAGVKLGPSLKHPEGETIWFTDRNGHKAPKYLALAEKIFPIANGDTFAVGDEIMRLCRALKIRPEHLAVDRTGNGQGVYDYMRARWSPMVIGVNFYEGASDVRVFLEDEDTAKELYDRVNSELWFALRRWLEFKYLFVAFELDSGELYPELTDRLFRMVGKKSHVESKKEYKSRHAGKSPDNADAFTLFLQACRKGFGFTPSMAGDTDVEPVETQTDEWNPHERDIGCDRMNRFEDLDTAVDDLEL